MKRAREVCLLPAQVRAFVALAVVLLGCNKSAPQPSADATTGGGTATIAAEATVTTLGVQPAVEPTVTFALPTGEVAADTPIVLAFSEPMVPLAAIDLPTALTGVTVTPDVPIQWRWVATDTVVGQPQPGWPHAQTIAVRLAPQLRTRAGTPLQNGLAWQFETAAPTLVWTFPSESQAFAARDSSVVLCFDQPLDPAELRAHVTVTNEDDRQPLPPFQVVAIDPKALPDGVVPPEFRATAQPGQWFALRFATRLPPWQRIEVEVTPGLAGKSGPLRTKISQSLRFGTAGGASDPAGGALEPFTLLQVSDNTNPDPEMWRAAQLTFSTQLPPIDQSKLLTASPAVADLALQCYDKMCSIVGTFAPATTYTLTVSPRLEDAHGRRLGKPIVITRTFGHRAPMLEIATDGTVMELQQKPHAVAVTLRNLKQVTARAFRVPADAPWSVLVALKVDDPGYAAAVAKLGPPIALAIKPSEKPDAIERRVLDLDAVLAGKPGHVWLELVTPDVVQPADERWRPSGREGRLFQVTDLHIAAKKARNETLFWVTSLQTGQPVAGARVALLDQKDSVVWRSTTNAEGLVTGPGGMMWRQGRKETERRVVAAIGEDAALLQLLEPSEWAQEDDAEDGAERGWLFTDKPVYRQGETVQVKGLLRLVGKDALGLPAAGREAHVRLVDPVGRIVAETQVHFSPRGTFAAALTVPANSRYGSWSVRVVSQHTTFSKSVHVAVYHVPRTKLDLTLKAAHLTRGDVQTAELQAAWFSGGPLEHAPAHVTASAGPESFEPPNWPQCQFGIQTWMEDDAPGARNVLDHDARGTTDDHGHVAFQVPTAVAMDRSLHVEVAASVRDPNGLDMAATRQFWLHPAAALVGVALPSALVQANSPVPLQLIAVDPLGVAQPGLPLAVNLQRREWKSIRVRGMAGEMSWQTRMVQTPAGSCALTSAALPVDCSLTAGQPGLYTLQATVRDRKGRIATTTADFYVVGPNMAWGPDDGDQPFLVPDKKSYKVGETAHILVRNQVPGALALVTEERAGILRTKLVKLATDAPTLDVLIEARHAPNVHIGVLALAGRRSDGALGLDTGAPSSQMDAIELLVDPADHQLQVTITPEHAKALPGQKMSVEVQVRDAAGRPRAAEVALWAVDEGVMALTGEPTPDPLTTLYAAIDRGVEDALLMDTLVRRRAGELKGEPGGGGGEHGAIRTNLRDVAFWQPAIELPADGKARHTFTLPDNLTTWRIMAVAIDGPGDFGSADAQIEASKPLMIQPASPKSVAVGDELELTATVRNRQTFAVTVQIDLQLTGSLVLRGAANGTLGLAPQQSQEVRFRVRAQSAGQAKAVWRATATASHHPGAVDSTEEVVEVKTLQPLETVASWAHFTGSRVDVLRKTDAIVADRGALKIAISGSLAEGAQVAIAALTDYPYACTEQLASRLQGLLALDKLRGNDKTALAELTGEPKVLAQKWIDRILARAQPDGGLALWDAGKSDTDATLWALWVLADAKAAGLNVDKDVLTAAARWLQTRGEKDQQVEILAVQAAVGLASPVTAEAFLAGSAALPVDDQLWLAAALTRLDPMRYHAAARNLLDPLLRQARVDGESSYLADVPSRWHWASALQRQAQVIELLTLLEPNHPLLPRLTRWLVRQQGGHGWRSTHDNAWALRALVAQSQTAVDGSYAFLVGDAQKLAGTVGRGLHVDRTEIPQSQLPLGDTPLRLDRHGQGPLWLRLEYSYAPQTPPEEGRNGGFLLRRRLFTVKGEPVTGPLQRGDQVIVQLEVTAGDAWEDVAVVDRPAAGLEPVDLQFANHDAGLATRLGALQVDRHARVANVQNTELAGREVRFFADLTPGTQVFRYLARAASRGRFLGAGARAEAMYRPDIFGTSGASRLDIE